MSTYNPKELLVIAKALVDEGGYKGNPLMEKPEIRQIVNEMIQARKTVTEPQPPTTLTS